MCFDPATMATLASIGQSVTAAAPYAAAAGTAVTAVGTGIALQQQAKTAERNAEISKLNADTTRAAGAAEAERVSERYRRVYAAQNAATAKAGLVPGSGSPGLLLGETGKNEALDMASTIWNRNTEATAYENKASGLRQDAAGLRRSIPYAVGGSLLSSIGQLRNATRVT